MGFVDDPISGIIGVFFKRALDSKVMQYAKLVLEMSIAATVAFFAACGMALMTQPSVSWAIGAGMVATAVALIATFQTSPNSKGLVIAVNKETVHVISINKSTTESSDVEVTTVKGNQS